MLGDGIIVPKKRALYRYAVDTFINILERVQSRCKEYRCNNQDVMCWNAFVDAYSDIILTKGFIYKFCQYGINSWFNDNPNVLDLHKFNCRFSWIFSKKAIQRWNKLGAKNNEIFIRKVIKEKYQASLSNVKPHLRSALINLRPTEEKFKSELHNTRRALSWCIANTTLYNHRSSWCVSCDYKDECKDILQKNYPKVYKLRGY